MEINIKITSVKRNCYKAISQWKNKKLTSIINVTDEDLKIISIYYPKITKRDIALKKHIWELYIKTKF